MAPVNRQDPTYRLRHSAAHVMAQAVKEICSPRRSSGVLRDPFSCVRRRFS